MEVESQPLEELQHTVTDLRKPWVFVVAGEVKSGKSALLNALFGEEICRTDALPATEISRASLQVWP